MLLVLVDILNIIINVIVMLIIVQFIFGLLLMFNVISMRNGGVAQIYSALNALLEPLYAPVRRILPDTGAMDFSPLVVLIGLQIIQRVLEYAAVSI